MVAGKRIAQEAQLLDEERWILNALKGIRAARSCLQIERLQLESLSHRRFKRQPSEPEACTATPATSSAPAAGTVAEHPKSEQASIRNLRSTASALTRSTVKDLDDEVCNFEELNLSVSRPVFNLTDRLDFNEDFEEEDESEEEDDDDNDDEENIEIDMNMFMNAERQAEVSTSTDR